MMKFLISGRPTRSIRARSEPAVTVSAMTATSGLSPAPNNAEWSSSTTMLNTFCPARESTPLMSAGIRRLSRISPMKL
jgi:hypothetical protein